MSGPDAFYVPANAEERAAAWARHDDLIAAEGEDGLAPVLRSGGVEWIAPRRSWAPPVAVFIFGFVWGIILANILGYWLGL